MTYEPLRQVHCELTMHTIRYLALERVMNLAGEGCRTAARTRPDVSDEEWAFAAPYLR